MPYQTHGQQAQANPHARAEHGKQGHDQTTAAIMSMMFSLFTQPPSRSPQ